MYLYVPTLRQLPALRLTWRALLLSVALFAAGAHADEYADVNRLIRSGQLSEALNKAEQYLSGKPRDPQMRFIKGVIQTESGKPNDAIVTFVKITEDYPELPEPYNNLAVLYAGQSQYDKARSSLEMAIRTNPSYATAHENLGDVYAKLASQAYGKALQLDSSNTGVQPKLALIRTLFAPDAKGQKPMTDKSAPVVATAIAEPTTPAVTNLPATAASNNDEKAVEDAVLAWAKAWSSKDVTAYLEAYAKDFRPPQKQSRKSWEEARRSRIVNKASISVRVSKMVTVVNNDKASVRFRQDYSAGPLQVTSHKTLTLVKVGERWLITRESSGD